MGVGSVYRVTIARVSGNRKMERGREPIAVAPISATETIGTVPPKQSPLDYKKVHEAQNSP
jgi:hypothetical protein